MAGSDAGLRMVSLKMSVMGETSPAYRMAVVPENITFTQLAWILEEMLELPKTDRFEFDITGRQEKIRGRRLKKKSGKTGSEEGIRILNGDGLYIGDWMEYEEEFGFQMLDSGDNPDESVPRYQIGIMGTEDADDTQYSAPMITDAAHPSQCAYWVLEEEKINEVLREKYALIRTDTPVYPDVARLKAEAKKGGGISWCTRPFCRVSRAPIDPGTAAWGIIDMLLKLADENEDVLHVNGEPTKEQQAKLRKMRRSAAKKMLFLGWDMKRRGKRTMAEISFQDTESLEAYLSGYDRSDLEKLSMPYEISTSGLGTKELAHEIAGAVLDPEHMKKALLVVDEELLDLYERCMDRRVFTLPVELMDEIIPLIAFNCIFTLSDDILLTPRDVAAAYRDLVASGYRTWHRQIRWIMDCESCFNNIFVLGPAEVLYELFLQDEEMKDIDEQTFWSLVSEVPEAQRSCERRDGDLYGKYIQEDAGTDIDAAEYAEDAAFIRMRQESWDVPYCIPTAEEIRRYSAEDYPSWEPSYQALKKFYLEEMQLSEDTAETLLKLEYRCSGAGMYINGVIEDESADDLVFSSEDQLERFVRLYDDAYLHTRSFVMKGYTPGELGKLVDLKREEERRRMGLQDTQFQVSFDPSGIRTGVNLSLPGLGGDQKGKTGKGRGKGAAADLKKSTKKMAKVYPNDPCPCGSGKKYKKCHGKNAGYNLPAGQ